MTEQHLASQGEARNPLRFIGSCALPELDDRRVPIYQWEQSRAYIVGSGYPVDPGDPPRSRPDLADLEPSALYRHSDTGWTVRVLGNARMEELRGEVVGICQVIDRDDAFLVLTQYGYRLGERLAVAAPEIVT